jgi:hypothetical protein
MGTLNTPRERALLRAVRRELDALGAYHVTTTGVGRVGVPDLLVCHRGRFYGIELKTDDGRLRPMQRHHLDLIRRASGVGLVARSVDDVIAGLTSADA